MNRKGELYMDETLNAANELEQALLDIAGALTEGLSGPLKQFTSGFLSAFGVTGEACNQFGKSAAESLRDFGGGLGSLPSMLKTLLSSMTLVVAGIAAVAGRLPT